MPAHQNEGQLIGPAVLLALIFVRAHNLHFSPITKRTHTAWGKVQRRFYAQPRNSMVPGRLATAMHDCNRPLFTLSDTESNKTAHKALFGSMERVP